MDLRTENNTIIFGKYPQGSKSEIKPLEWDILDEKDGKLLVISHDILALNVFDKKTNNYKDSSIRKWLDFFYNEAFDAVEHMKIVRTDVDNSAKSTTYDTNPYTCENTKDNIFILSYEEVKKYMPTKESRYCVATENAKDGITGGMSWWLRSPYFEGDDAALGVYTGDGKVSIYYVDDSMVGIRPAMWVKDELEFYKVQEKRNGQLICVCCKETFSCARYNMSEKQWVYGNMYLQNIINGFDPDETDPDWSFHSLPEEAIFISKEEAEKLICSSIDEGEIKTILKNNNK